MNKESLIKSFNKIGATLTIEENKIINSPKINVVKDNFVILHNPSQESQIDVINISAKERHLLISVKTPSDIKSKVLCGHDERHWFSSELVKRHVTTVEEAKQSLQPDKIKNISKTLKNGERSKRHNQGWKRQGEWFFVPVPDFNPPKNSIIKQKDKLIRPGSRSKAHVCDEVYTPSGGGVWVSNQGLEISDFKYNKLSEIEKSTYTFQSKVAMAYVRGNVRHPDHKTIYLPCWHEVHLNNERIAGNSSVNWFYD